MTVVAALVFSAQSAPARRLPVRDSGDVLLYGVAAIALLVVGGLLILVSRRRR